MTTNRSSEELMMRDQIETWGRGRWPDARVFHELVVSDCRVDIAFIRPRDLIGIEIKSSKDVLTRAEKQVRVFGMHFPEFWVAIAPKWKDHPDKPYCYNEIVVDESGVDRGVYGGWRPQRNGQCYSTMLGLVWADEARAIAGRKGCLSNKRQSLASLLPELALRLTGGEILEEVCRELRSRPTKFKADPPVYEGAKPEKRSLPNLFGAPVIVGDVGAVGETSARHAVHITDVSKPAK